MNFGELLSQLRKKADYKQEYVAKQIGVQKNTVSNYENNVSKPHYEQLVKLCNLFGVDANYLLQDDIVGTFQQDQQILAAYKNLNNSDKQKIVDFILEIGEYDIKNNPIEKELQKIYILPVYQQDVAAGSGQLGFDQKHEMEEFCEENMPNKISYGIKIKGTSMETDDEKTIPDKSTVLVTTELDYNELVGESVIVNINGTLVCKEYNIAEDGHLWLKSRNRNKSNEDKHIYDIDGVKIIGKVAKVIL